MQDLKELGFILLIIVFVIAGVQWFLLRFTHWAAALAATGFIGLFISFIYVSLKHANPNGGSNGPPASEYIAPTVIIISSLLVGMWLVSYASKIYLPKLVILIPLCLMVVFAIGSIVYEYVSSTSFYFTNFSTCKIEVKDETGGKSNVDVILFQNSSSGYTTDIHTKFKEDLYPQMIRFADTIIFRYYSEQTQKEFVQEFPFDYTLFKEKDGPTVGYCFWIRSHETLPMKIVLLPNDKVDIYLGGNLVKQYQVKNSDSLTLDTTVDKTATNQP